MTNLSHIVFQIKTSTGQTALTYGVKKTNMISNIETTASSPETLASIEVLTTRYSTARKLLAQEVAELNDEIEALKRKRMGRIKQWLGRAADHYAALDHAIKASPQLFDKPKTQTFAGIKVGYRKGTGGIDWADDAKVVALIEKHFTKPQAELLIKTTKKPIAKALADLDVADLKKIGCTVEATGEVVFIKPTDSAVDKIINALMKEATECEEVNS